MEFIQISVRGWPTKSDDKDVRLIFTFDEREEASAVMTQLGGLFRCEMKAVDKIPVRGIDEITKAQAIKDSITTQDYTQ